MGKLPHALPNLIHFIFKKKEFLVLFDKMKPFHNVLPLFEICGKVTNRGRFLNNICEQLLQ